MVERLYMTTAPTQKIAGVEICIPGGNESVPEGFNTFISFTEEDFFDQTRRVGYFYSRDNNVLAVINHWNLAYRGRKYVYNGSSLISRDSD